MRDSHESKLPYLCAKCGAKRSLKTQDHKFRFRPLIGWLAIPFGMTIEIVWNAKVYFCNGCSDKIRNTHRIAILPPIIGILLAILSLFLTFVYLDSGFTFLLLGLLSFVGGVIAYAFVYNSADPKTVQVNRQSLILDLPDYGAFDYTKSRDVVRVK